MDFDPNEEHFPVPYRSGLVCACGDFSCASVEQIVPFDQTDIDEDFNDEFF